MPGRKRASVPDDEAGPSQSQPRVELTQVSFSQADKFSEADLNTKARNIVRFFIACAGRRLPIKRQEIIDKVMKDMPRAFNIVLDRAKPIIEDTFGLRIVELPNKLFCVVNAIDLDTEYTHLQWSDVENQQTALVMICLSIIFMSGDAVQDDILYEALTRMDVDVSKHNPIFGDVKKLLTQDLVQQGYLLHKRIQDTDPPKFQFTWGPKAEAMTSKEDVLSFVCQICKKEMHDYPQQYDSIYGEGAAAKSRLESTQLSQA